MSTLAVVLKVLRPVRWPPAAGEDARGWWSSAPRRWQGGRVHAAQFILYVADQGRARDFYRHVLAAEPVLDVPGMTEFDLGGATLGLMPAADIEALLSGQIRAGAGQRCELYLRRSDAAAALARAADSGGRLLDGLRDRSWGERAGYLLDPDGHVLALAAAGSADEGR